MTKDDNMSALWGIVIVLLLVVGVLAWFVFATPRSRASHEVATTTPELSTSTNPAFGETPPEPTAPLSQSVVVTSPRPGASVEKSFTVAGNAPGPWFFEAVFPIKVFDQSNKTIGVGQAHAQGDWMTTGPVTFTATITTSGYSGNAVLVLMRDNPSGLPENDDSVSLPIIIK